MKQFSKTSALVSLFLLLLTIYHSSPRLLPSSQGDTPLTKLKEINLQDDDFSNLTGLKECGERNEDCDKRRMVAEAHLDYIYTQHHKP